MEYQYNNKRHVATGRIPFELNFEKHPWKGNLVTQMNFPRIEEAIQHEKKKPSRIKGWRQYVGGKQEYSFELTLKEVGSQEIQIF